MNLEDQFTRVNTFIYWFKIDFESFLFVQFETTSETLTVKYSDITY